MHFPSVKRQKKKKLHERKANHIEVPTISEINGEQGKSNTSIYTLQLRGNRQCSEYTTQPQPLVLFTRRAYTHTQHSTAFASSTFKRFPYHRNVQCDSPLSYDSS